MNPSLLIRLYQLMLQKHMAESNAARFPMINGGPVPQPQLPDPQLRTVSGIVRG